MWKQLGERKSLRHGIVGQPGSCRLQVGGGGGVDPVASSCQAAEDETMFFDFGGNFEGLAWLFRKTLSTHCLVQIMYLWPCRPSTVGNAHTTATATFLTFLSKTSTTCFHQALNHEFLLVAISQKAVISEPFFQLPSTTFLDGPRSQTCYTVPALPPGTSRLDMTQVCRA